MTAKDQQVRIAMRERKKGKSQTQAAATANLGSRKTVSKYERLGMLPSALRRPREYRTREDKFAEDWAEIEELLQAAPELEAKALLEWLCEEKPGRYEMRQLRTLQRRLSKWRALNVGQVATLPQVRVAGEAMQLDGTWMTELGVTIGGVTFKHMVIHCVLPYSNWEWGRVVQSESLGAVRLSVQSALVELGAVPTYLQTDNSSAATRPLGIHEQGREGYKRTYTDGYLHLLNHYGLEPQTTHIHNPNENGDVEASNGAFKRAVKQHLLLRGSRDFADIDSYEAFLFAVMRRRNAARQTAVNEELAVMKPLLATQLATQTEQKVRVSRNSLINVQGKIYSVPTSLIGKKVMVYLHEWSLDVYFGGQHIESLPRLIGNERHHINYRHLIDSLLRKPGGFRRYRYREDLFPSLIFRRAWEQLDSWYSSRRADLAYLRVLHLAARTLESDVALALEMLVERGHRWDVSDVKQLVGDERATTVPPLAVPEVDLVDYDQFFEELRHA